MNDDAFGDRMKFFEESYERVAMPGLPLLARLDGRTFHTYTRGLERPYSPRLAECMQETTRFLVNKTHALVGYTQSDEISLAWYHPPGAVAQFDFGGRIQKLASVLAGQASAKFALLAAELLPEKKNQLPVFDCRVWQVPDLQTAADAFQWREDDATKNSVTMAASVHYSHRELHGKNSADKHELLHAKGVNWNDYPVHFKRGVYFRRAVVKRVMTDAERERVPDKHRPPPSTPITRHEIVDVQMPPLRQVPDRVDALFGKKTP